MQPDRYARAFAPSEPKSVPDYLNHEHQKLERVIDSLRQVIADHEARLLAGGL
jgi:hypothetical protein